MKRLDAFGGMIDTEMAYVKLVEFARCGHSNYQPFARVIEGYKPLVSGRLTITKYTDMTWDLVPLESVSCSCSFTCIWLTINHKILCSTFCNQGHQELSTFLGSASTQSPGTYVYTRF